MPQFFARPAFKGSVRNDGPWVSSSVRSGYYSFTPWLRLRTPGGIFVKYGPCSRRRLAPVARFQDKVARMPLCVRVGVYIELLYGSVQPSMLKLRGSLGNLTMGTV